MPNSKGNSKFTRCLRAPIRCLCWARDFYIRSLNECAGQMPCEPSFGYPIFGHADRSYSLRSNWSNTSSDDDMSELIQATTENKVPVRKSGSNVTVLRSHSAVGIGRIDEDKPCEFKDCDFKVGSSLVYSRSRSCVSGQSGQVKSRTRHVSFC